MTIEVKEFEFTCNTGTAAQTIASGLGFTPKGYILFSVMSTTDATYQNHANVMIGFSDGTTSACMGMGSEDAVASSDAGFYHENCILKFTSQTVPDSTEDARATHTSFGSGTIAINWSNLPAAAYRVWGLAFGGTDFSCEVKQFTTGRSTVGQQSYTTTMSTPQCVFLLPTTSTTTPSQITNHGELNFGIALSASKRACISIVSEDGRATMDTWRLLDDTKCLTTLDPSSGGIDAVADFVSFDANGFTLNYTDQPSSSTAVFYAMVMKGGLYDMGVVAKRTSTGDTVVNPSGVGTVKGIFLFSDNTTKSATVQAHNRISLGVGSSSTDKGGAWTGDTDAAADAITAKRGEDSNILIMATETATPTSSTTEAIANLSATGTNTFTLSYSTATALAADIVWWVIGESTSQNFNGDITESSISVNQTLARILGALRPISDPSISSGETLTRLLGALRSISESSITIDQTLTGIRSVPRSISEPEITVDQTISRLLAATRPINETSISVNQTLERILGALRSINESSITSGETLSRILGALRPISESSISVDETLTRLLGATRAITESSITVNQTLTRILGALRSISEPSISSGEALTRILGALRSITESSISVGETLTRLLGALRSIAETAITTDDSVTGIKQTGGVSITEDAITINDSVTRIQGLIKTITEDTITIDDTIVRILGALRTVSEPSISINDSVTRLRETLRTISEDAITIDDTVTRIQNIIKTITEDTDIDQTVQVLRTSYVTIVEAYIKWYYSLLTYKGGS